MKKLNYKCFNIDIYLCSKFKDRFLGLMGKKDFNYGLEFNKCRSIHTFFMKKNLCLVLLDRDKNIYEILNNIKPWRIYIFSRKVKSIIELPDRKYNLRIGQKLD